MKKKDLKLILIGAVVILCGALMFFDKIAEIAKLDTTQMPFSVVNTISTPFVGIRKGITNEDELAAEKARADKAEQNAKEVTKNAEETDKKLKHAESKASQWKYFYIKVNNAPPSWFGNNIAVVSTSSYTSIPINKDVLFLSENIEWTNEAFLFIRKFNNDDYKELSSLDYNDFAKNDWDAIRK